MRVRAVKPKIGIEGMPIASLISECSSCVAHVNQELMRVTQNFIVYKISINSMPFVSLYFIFFYRFSTQILSSLFCDFHELSIKNGNCSVLFSARIQPTEKNQNKKRLTVSSVLSPLVNEWCRKCSHFFDRFRRIFHRIEFSSRREKIVSIDCESSSNRDEKFDSFIGFVWFNSEWKRIPIEVRILTC